METLLYCLNSLKNSVSSVELLDEDGLVRTRVLKDDNLTSVFINNNNYFGCVHYSPLQGFEHIQLQKKSNRGRWTPKQRQTLQALGFTFDGEYASRRNVP